MPLPDDAAMLQRLRTLTLVRMLVRLDTVLTDAQTVAESDGPTWHLIHEACVALRRLIVHLDPEESH
jgi:hypothetical protein